MPTRNGRTDLPYQYPPNYFNIGKIGDVLKTKGQKLEYLYDFGDYWQHSFLKRQIMCCSIWIDISWIWRMRITNSKFGNPDRREPSNGFRGFGRMVCLLHIIPNSYEKKVPYFLLFKGNFPKHFVLRCFGPEGF